MAGTDLPQTNQLDEELVKTAVAEVDWCALKHHFDAIGLTREQLTQICGHIRRCTDLICKYPRKALETRRAQFFDQLRADAAARFGAEAESEVAAEIDLLALVEHGYRAILGVLAKCPISERPAVVRAAASVSRAGYEYVDLMQRHHAALAASRELNLLSDLRLRDDEGNSFSADAVLDGLAETVVMTLIMEAYENSWFERKTDIVILPELPAVGDPERFQAGATQVTAAFWRQWQRVEKRRRYTGGELRARTGADLPRYLPPHLKTVIEYHPPEDGLSEPEVYHELAQCRSEGVHRGFLSDGLRRPSRGRAGYAGLPQARYQCLV